MTQTAHLRTAALALALGLAGCTTPRTPYEAPAVAVPTQWPHNAWQREAADRTVAQLLGAYRHRILRPVNALSATKLLLQKRIPEQLPSPLSNACRAVARQVLEVLEIDFTDHGTDDEADDAVERLPAAEMPLRLTQGARRNH